MKHPARSVHLKVCCIASVEEAERAIAAGATALGLVSRMPSGPGVIDEETIAAIAAASSSRVATFLLTSGLDVCSGLRTDGHLDPIKVAAFTERISLARGPAFARQ